MFLSPGQESASLGFPVLNPCLFRKARVSLACRVGAFQLQLHSPATPLGVPDGLAPCTAR